MSKVLRDLPEEWINAELAELLRVSAEQKGAVQTFSSDSVMTNVVQSENPYDIQVNSLGFNNRAIEIVYTPTEVTFAGQGTILKFWWTETYASTSNTAQAYPDELEPAANGVQKFRLYLSGNDANPPAWGRYKFYFETIGSGTFAASLLY